MKHRAIVIAFVSALLCTLFACSGSVLREKQTGTSPSNNSQAVTAATPSSKQLGDYELMMITKNGSLTPLKLSQTVGGGKVVVIDFWATWCGPCRKSIPDLVALHDEYNNKGVEIYGLSIEEPNEPNRINASKKNLEAVINMSKDFKINYKVGFAPDSMFLAFDQTGVVPQTFIFGKDGSLIKHLRGFNPQIAPQIIRENIDKALNS